MIRRPSKGLLCSALALAIAGVHYQAHASGFSLYGEMNGSNSGNYAAGGAAEARDASSLFYNPAGLTRLHNKQLVLAGTGVFTSGKFTGTETSLGGSIASNGVQGGTDNFVPAFYYAQPLNNKYTVGLGVYAPFGLSTDWGEQSSVRFSATKSELITVNVSPAVAAKINDKLSFGLAIDVQYAKVKLNSVTGQFPVAEFAVHNTGDSVGVGAHGGFLYEASSATRFGINYQSQVSHKFKGDSLATRIVGPTASASLNNLFSDPIAMPGQATLSAFHQVSNSFAVMGTVAYTEWKKIHEIVMNNVQASTGGSVPRVAIPENFKNTWRVVGGADYRWDEKLTLRGGVGYDQTPTNNTDRSLRLPDANRLAVAIGGHYQVKPNVGVDLGYTHIFIKEAPINNVSGFVTTVGNVKAHADLVGAQLTWNFDGPVKKTK